MTKNIETLISDIYSYLEQEDKGGISDADADELGRTIATVLKNRVEERRRDKFTLRISNFGLPPRRLWFDANRPKYKYKGPTLFKFLYGDLIEAMAIFYTKRTGHKVEGEQATIHLEGIEGHIDVDIDGVTVDVKSASKWAWEKKFKGGSILRGDDAFAYIPQLLGYKKARGTKRAAFLSINKETGELALVEVPPEADKQVDVSGIAKEAQEIIKLPEPPKTKCYVDEAEGTSGNRVLNKNCSWCPHKLECHKDANGGRGLRVFDYAKGPVFFTNVAKLPKVDEITSRFNNEYSGDEE